MKGALAIAVVLASSGAACARRAPLFVPYPEAEIAGERNPHLFRGKPLCQRCHRPGGELLAEPVALCRRCHRPVHGNHPVGVPAGTVPAKLPLDGGKIVCHTCHDPHDIGTRASGLRIRAGEICLQCHVGHR